MIYFGSLNNKKRKKNKLQQKTKMVDRIKMTAKNEFSIYGKKKIFFYYLNYQAIAQSIFMQINWNLGFGKNNFQISIDQENE
jgi:hypothetical protein